MRPPRRPSARLLIQVTIGGLAATWAVHIPRIDHNNDLARNSGSGNGLFG
jgi:hypothetical protein